MLTALLGFFGQLTGKWATFLGTTKGKNTLSDFFKEGTNALLAFMNLGGAVIKLFLAIAGPGGGAKTGIDLLVGATGGINKLADSINSGGKAAKFFHDMFQITKDVIKDLAPLFTSIGSELGKTFTEKGVGSVKGFVDFFAKFAVPALGSFIRYIGGATALMGNFLDKNPDVAKFAASFAAIAASGVLVGKALGLVFGPLKGLLDFAETVGSVVTKLGGMEVVVDLIGEALLDFVLPVAFVAGVALLLNHFGLLHPLVEAAKKGFDDIVKIAGPPFQDLVKQVGRLWDAFSKGKGAFAIIKPILTFFTNQILIRGIKLLADFIGNELAGAFKILAGMVGLVVDILTGQWGRAWDDVKKIFSGFKQIAFAGVNALIDAFGDLPKKIVNVFKNVINAILKFLGIDSPSKTFHGIGVNLVDGLINGLAGLGGKLLNVFVNGFNVVTTFLSNLPGS